MTGDELFDHAASVNSRKEFADFVDYLVSDFQNRGEEWENRNLESFLSGLSSFANDMAGFYKNMGEAVNVETVTWRMTAQMLLAASVYGN